MFFKTWILANQNTRSFQRCGVLRSLKRLGFYDPLSAFRLGHVSFPVEKKKTEKQDFDKLVNRWFQAQERYCGFQVTRRCADINLNPTEIWLWVKAKPNPPPSPTPSWNTKRALSMFPVTAILFRATITVNMIQDVLRANLMSESLNWGCEQILNLEIPDKDE